MKYYTLTQYADKLGMSRQLLHNHIKLGKVKVKYKTIAGKKFIISK